MLYTLTALQTFQEDIKKSRFLALAVPVADPPAALRFFADHSIPAATHNCWAYRIGSDYRFNDDGEPSGTAGRPILQAIDGQQCDHVAVLIVRWFGGIKLGSGGLMRAYGGAAAQCLREAPKIELIDMVKLSCRCAFGAMAVVQSRFAGFDARVYAEEFDQEGVTWGLELPQMNVAPFTELFGNLTRGQGQCRQVGKD